jgi:hypothetical protein
MGARAVDAISKACGRMAQPMRMAICWMILMPVWRACHDFFD